MGEVRIKKRVAQEKGHPRQNKTKKEEGSVSEDKRKVRQ